MSELKGQRAETRRHVATFSNSVNYFSNFDLYQLLENVTLIINFHNILNYVQVYMSQS